MRLISSGLTPDGVDGDIHCTFRRPPCVSLDDRLYDSFFFRTRTPEVSRMRFLKLFPVFAFAALLTVGACQQAQDAADSPDDAMDDAAGQVEGMADEAMDDMEGMADEAMDEMDGMADDAMDAANPCSPDADAANPCAGDDSH